MPARHLFKQLHILASGNIPAEVLAHIPVLQGDEGIAVVIVQVQTPLHRAVEIVAVVALEGKAQAALALFVTGGTVSRRPPVAWTTGTVP